MQFRTHMIKQKILLFGLLGICLFSACIDEIDFDVPNEFQNTTVIIGKIVKGNPSKVEVSIQKVFDFAFEGEVFVNAQSVRIVNEAGTKLEVPISGPGEYELYIDAASGFDVEIGNSYSLEVGLFDQQTFKSESAVLIPVPEMEAVDHRLVMKEVLNFENELEVQPRIEYAVNTSLISNVNQARTSLKWDFERTYKQSDTEGGECYVSGFADFDLIQTINANEVTATDLNDYLVLDQRLSNTMVEGQYVSVIQEALDEDAIKFWEQIEGLSSNNGTFYEPPPGQIISNFENISDIEGSVFGYFYATQHDTINLFVDSLFINQFATICPRPPGQNPNPPCDDCCDCTQLSNSTTVKPSFWTR